MMNKNPYKSPEPTTDKPVRQSAPFYGTGKKARIAFYVQAISLVLCIIVGMSETYSWLAWGQWLVPCAFLPLVNVFFPLVILILGHLENVSPGRLFIAVGLSAMMTLASFYAILPLC